MNEYTKILPSVLPDKYPGYLFEITEYSGTLVIWIRSRSSRLEIRKCFSKDRDIVFIDYEIEKTIMKMREEELKTFADNNFLTDSYLDIRPMSINKYSVVPKELIFQDEKTTIINWTDNTKTIVKCSDEDVFIPEAGVALCYVKKFFTDNDSKRFHRLLKSLVSNSKFKKSKQEDKSSGLATLIKEAVNIIYALEDNHDIDTGASDNSGDNDPDGSAVEVES